MNFSTGSVSRFRGVLFDAGNRSYCPVAPLLKSCLTGKGQFGKTTTSFLSPRWYKQVDQELTVKRQVEFVDGPLDDTALDLETIRKELFTLGFSVDVDKLREALEKEYPGEIAFDMGLFSALDEAITPAGTNIERIEQKNKNHIVFSFKYKIGGKGEPKDLYLGLVRQFKTDRAYVPDQCVAVFEKENKVDKKNKKTENLEKTKQQPIEGGEQEFIVKRLLGALELKGFGKPGTSGFAFDNNGWVQLPKLERDHGALGQELFYMLTEVWPDICSYQMKHKDIPLVVLVAKKSLKGENEAEHKNEDEGVISAHSYTKDTEEKWPRGQSDLQFSAKEKTEIKAATANRNKFKKKDSVIASMSGRLESDSCGTLRCAYAKLIVAQECCSHFQYRILGFSTYEDEVNATRIQVDTAKETNRVVVKAKTNEKLDFAVAAALEIIRFGFQVAVDDACAGVQPLVPLSGRRLVIEGITLYQPPLFSEPPLGATKSTPPYSTSPPPLSVVIPVYNRTYLQVLATTARSSTQQSNVKVSQGDLFHGSIAHQTMLELKAATSRRSNDYFWFSDIGDSEERYDVIVKASSSAVHPLMMPVTNSRDALSSVMRNQNLKNELSKVLILVGLITPVGAVTIMHDLRDEYQILSPQKLSAKLDKQTVLSLLWNALDRSVNSVLLPLAQGGIVHFDLRPGFDETSNILVNTSLRSWDFALIDLESLVRNSSLPAILNRDGRFVPTTFRSTAVEYLWWQCLRLAYVWSEEINQHTLQKDTGMKLLKEHILKTRADGIENSKDLIGHLLRNGVGSHVWENNTVLNSQLVIKTEEDVKTLIKVVKDFFEFQRT